MQGNTALIQWLNYSKVGCGTLNSGVNVEHVPVVQPERAGTPTRDGGMPARAAGTAFRPVLLNLITARISLHLYAPF